MMAVQPILLPAELLARLVYIQEPVSLLLPVTFDLCARDIEIVAVEYIGAAIAWVLSTRAVCASSTLTCQGSATNSSSLGTTKIPATPNPRGPRGEPPLPVGFRILHLSGRFGLIHNRGDSSSP